MPKKTDRVEFLGHDDQGKAVFRNCEYPCNETQVADLSPERLTWNRPDLFRISPELARDRYGNDYMKRSDAVPEPQWPAVRDIFRDEWNRAATRPRNEALEKRGAAIEAEILKGLWSERGDRTEPERDHDTDLDR